MITFTDKQRAAILQAGKTMGRKAFSSQAAVVIGFVGQVEKGKRGCDDATYMRIWSLLVKHGGLDPNDRECWPAEVRGQRMAQQQPPAPGPLAIHEPPTEWRHAKPIPEIPILGYAQAAQIGDINEPLDDFCVGEGLDKRLCPGAGENWFYLRAAGSSMEPLIPDTSLLVVASDREASSGDLVVARFIDNGQVVTKLYRTRGTTRLLESVNTDGENYTWDVVAEPRKTYWIRPVHEIVIDPRKINWRKLAGRI
jgi:SOS-response transcriptional repressor LexA